MRLEDIKTPAYVCEITKLKANLNLLNYVAKSSGAKVLCALKGFAFSPSMPLVATMLDGATCSGLIEAKYAKEHNFKEIHTYSPAFKDDEIDEVLNISNHVVFNSFNQWKRFATKARNSNASIGLRVNPNISASPTDIIRVLDFLGLVSRKRILNLIILMVLMDFIFTHFVKRALRVWRWF